MINRHTWVTRTTNPDDLIVKVTELEKEGYEIFELLVYEMGREDILIVARKS